MAIPVASPDFDAFLQTSWLKMIEVKKARVCPVRDRGCRTVATGEELNLRNVDDWTLTVSSSSRNFNR